eukprot:TRINITY_DN36227_c0_g1_i1.p1 TRINITY_DN36227_c0_g1~~TRINITY_DN36227_c0_g1_i1.p1  ORF type:complete len:413 (+),score=97.55 TRINITY_DN36227_c0_g1_i1:154-1392(+)
MVTEHFGALEPFAEPNWYAGCASPYYQQRHRDWRSLVRQFVESELKPFVDDWDEQHLVPREVLQKAYHAGVYSPHVDKGVGGTPPAGGWDSFMDLIWIDELMRCGCGGVVQVFGITTMALPPLRILGTQDPGLTDRVVRGIVTAQKQIALCISEPSAGSDVGGLVASAERSADGQHYILNGAKKWITCAWYADYFTVAARTGGPGPKGISILLVERESEGIKVKRMKMQGNWPAGTSHVLFEDVLVPSQNLIGRENQGFKALMLNFNHERFVIAVQANRCARLCLQEAIGYARTRKTFGQALSSHQVIRHKVAEMARMIESTHALLEQLAFQMDQGVKDQQLGKHTALAKVQASRTFEFCAREASQIFGGSSYVREGKGRVVERLYREVRSYAIPGGSEEIMLDLAMKQAQL